MKKEKPKLGRKPVEDKKLHIPLYVERSIINNLGGLEGVRIVAYEAIIKENIAIDNARQKSKK